jgi:hypothetical protein
VINDPSITKHGLKIPTDVTSYGEFAVKMRVYEQEFKRVFIVSTVEKNPKDFFQRGAVIQRLKPLMQLTAMTIQSTDS